VIEENEPRGVVASIELDGAIPAQAALAAASVPARGG
jgi:hypothetical protein